MFYSMLADIADPSKGDLSRIVVRDALVCSVLKHDITI